MCVCVWHIFVIHSSATGHLSCFYALAVVNGAATRVHVSFQIRVFIFSGHIPKSGVIRSYGSFFFFLTELYNLFQFSPGIEPRAIVLRASLVAQLVKNLPAIQETWVPSLGWEDPLEKGKAATHASILTYTVHGVAQSQTRLSDFHFPHQ